MFRLRKWYLDCVGDDGRSVIAYWSELEWAAVRASWHAVTLHGAETPPLHASSLSAVAEPVAADGRLAWRADALGCEIRGIPTLPAFEANLVPGRVAEGGQPVLLWRSVAPAARMDVRLGDRSIAGTGYAECLDLREPPWHLPIDELRWGRWVSDEADRSLVWIDWRGGQPQTLAYLDGVAVTGATVGDGAVEVDRVKVTLGDRRLLHERSLGDLLGTLARALPRMPRRWLALEDRKWLGRATLARGDGPGVSGWVVHERIVFP